MDNEEKLYLDTSILITRVIRPRYLQTKIDRLTEYRLYTSNYVKYEFMTGLIKTGIEYYFFVREFQSVSEALAVWSDEFAVRQHKNVELIQSVMASLNESLDTSSTESYLNQLEAAIIYLTVSYVTDITGFIGSFGSHEVFDAVPKSVEDFENFLTVVERNKHINLEEFWSERPNEIDSILKFAGENPLTVKKANWAKQIKNLSVIRTDPRKAAAFKVSRGSSDAVIASECSKNMDLVSFDNSFNILCPALEKNYKQISKDKKPKRPKTLPS